MGKVAMSGCLSPVNSSARKYGTLMSKLSGRSPSSRKKKLAVRVVLEVAVVAIVVLVVLVFF